MKHSSVPRLDLAPKLKRPLSLWNPLDYLRLLYWVFYFPQALRWYVDTFGGGYIPEEEMNWRKGWKLLRQNPLQRQLLIQGLVLTIITPLLLGLLLQEIGFSIDWLEIALGVTLGVASGVGFGVTSGVTSGVTLGVASGVASGVTLGVFRGVALGVASGVASGVFRGVALGVALGVGFGVTSGVALGVVGGMATGVVGGVALGVLSGVASGVVSGVAVAVAITRPENWFVALQFKRGMLQNHSWMLPRITLLPLISLSSRLQNWLRQDWETGLHNANQLLAYTLQFIPVVEAVNRVLATTPPEQVIFRVVKLAEAPYDWNFVRFASASLNAQLKSRFLKSFLLLPPHWKKRLQARLVKNTRLDTPARAAASGFWYLHEKEPAKALEAFTVVRSLLYGEEMFTLAQTLTVFHKTKEPATIATIQLPACTQEPLLRPTTWKVIASLSRVIEDVQVVERSVSNTARSFALNRALGELKDILNNQDILPKAEKDLIIDIAETWQEALLQIAGEVGEIAITEPIRNPYTIGDPVEGNLFIGREDIMRQLEELWLTNYQVQSVVIYGHRRMGKTSILRNIANCLGAEIKLAYINLLDVGDAPQGVGEVLMAICDGIAEAVHLPPPADEDLLNLPYPTFRRYLKEVQELLMNPPRVCVQSSPLDLDPPQPPLLRGENSIKVPGETESVASSGFPVEQKEKHPLASLLERGTGGGSILGETGSTPPKVRKSGGHQSLIIALDEFEQIEELINNGKIAPDLMKVLRASVQKSQHIAFAFAGLHTLEEMTEDYFQPFFTSFVPPIHVRFLPPAATHQILANPAIEDFPLDYTPETLDQIYKLTAGQPYLVQLVGFQLVNRYNNQVFEQKRDREPVFTLKDLEAVINNPDFLNKGRYYFTGVWGQATEGAPGQQEILRILAPHPSGLSQSALIAAANLNEFERGNDLADAETRGHGDAGNENPSSYFVHPLDEATLLAALQTLNRHDVIHKTQEGWRISVELFRRWVLGL
ncbi:MAG: ATP-binding protein [Symploca sp. SIO2D2]|nr:ATP-binding protein [Symploca sp. SIO2D2]